MQFMQLLLHFFYVLFLNHNNLFIFYIQFLCFIIFTKMSYKQSIFRLNLIQFAVLTNYN